MHFVFMQHLKAAVSGLALLFGTCSAPLGAPCAVIINEIMYAPRNDEPEWIEIYNAGERAIDLNRWTIEDADSTKPRLFTTGPMSIDPYGYVLIVQDVSGFLGHHPAVTCPVLEPLSGWPRLNNDGDRIVLRDSTGAVIDSLEYEDSWGGGDGVSLERIRPDWPSDSPRSWSSCVLPSESTPCEQNSIHALSLVGKASLLADPDPFDRETTISYKLTVPTAIVKLNVYDIRGRLVRTLIDQEPSGSSGSVLWDGRDQEGGRLRVGVYILYLEAINAHMGVLDRTKKTVTLARKLN